MSAARPNVLLVDDREANLVALEAQLGDLDCELVRATNGNDALRLLLKREFALMLLDVQMPDMDGYELAQYSRDNPVTREVPIIFVTATHATPETALRGYGTGAVDFLFKPINPYILRSKVRVFLDLYLSRKRLADEVAAHEVTMRALEQSNDSLRHFTHAASHDLGAPLRAIDGFLEILDEETGASLDPESRKWLTWSRQGAKRIRALLDSLLGYAKLAKAPEWTDVDGATVVAQVREDLGDRFAANDAKLDVDELGVVRGDPSRIYQLFLNLIANALKFQRPGVPPVVTVSASERDGQRVFSVADNGIGIAPEHAQRIFEAFQRLHAPSKFEGTGLGLTICRQIVEQHGGRIWVENREGGGSAFHFTLPGRSVSAAG